VLYIKRVKQTQLMATRSRIGFLLKDESIVSVYCHWDGYPEYNGRLLRDHYGTIEKVRELIDGGNISALHTNAGWNNETLPESGPLYYTSRGETIEQNAPKYHGNLERFFAEDAEEYAYIFEKGEWVCYDTKSWSDTYMQKVEIPAGSV